MVKVILQLYPVIPAESEQERIELRPLGRNRGRYQETLLGWHEIVKAADELGLWGVATVEHHFHSEGYEVGPSPGVLNAHWASITNKVRVGALGYVMSTQDPIRVAEETAILDHLTQGRYFVGFARGYQSRWTNVLGQHVGGVAATSDGSAQDEQNRRVFEEQVDLVLRSWKNDSIEQNSDLWRIPNNDGNGPDAWPMTEWTRILGAPGEVNDRGELKRISVVPAPYTDPHPPVFVSSNSSLTTVEWAGDKGFIPVYFSSIGNASHYGPAYVKAAERAGSEVSLGQKQAIVRWPRIGKTRDDALHEMAEYDGDIFKHFYEPFLPAAKESSKSLTRNSPRSATVEPMLNSGLWIAGNVSEVRDEFVSQWKALPAEYAVLIYHYAQHPKESVIENLRLFMSEVKPALDEISQYEE